MSQTVRVLHIDDDPDTRLLLRELLAEVQQPDDDPQFRWLEASDVEEALEQGGAAGVDVVLLDNRLGAREGVDQIPRLRAAWHCPVWVLTGVPDRQLEERTARQGGEGLLAKDEVMLDGPRLRSWLARLVRIEHPAR